MPDLVTAAKRGDLAHFPRSPVWPGARTRDLRIAGGDAQARRP